MLRHKYNARRCELDGIKFSSQKERDYYAELLLRKAVGEVVFFLRQVPLHLVGGTKYVVDFVEFRGDGTVHFVDVKGVRTAMYRLKKKQAEALYPIEIEEV